MRSNSPWGTGASGTSQGGKHFVLNFEHRNIRFKGKVFPGLRFSQQIIANTVHGAEFTGPSAEAQSPTSTKGATQQVLSKLDWERETAR
ncbi:MAG: hypothetical protein ACJAX5_000023 [Patiriisocius sp.]|jgi:hypothetical protein